ncbi:hypothetical protein KVR01_001016 [Diaporthe batatas]|uniref:uncharacterized protein n=1 Tax=Diaporthe batatas TaxID=748121 RepID=UPI001D04BFDA|nr:uncharacterized protein KVR01_001016 [Diaporthe batatas]KAG8170271.1 hypothetical protein KVR01_001016 [Diaporthe batatas]
MSGNSPVDKPKSGRSATSCLECQRRKQKCSREWPCNHCQARKVPHLCQFAPKKVATPEDDSFAVPAKLSRKRKEGSFESDTSASASDPEHGLSDGLAKLGYMPSHEVFALTRSTADSSYGQTDDNQDGQSEEIEAALKFILPKPYTDVLVQNYLDTANLQYYPVFPEQLRGQSAKWWESRAAGQKLTPELTCLLLRVCAVSTQYLESSLLQRLEAELGEKAQTMTDRFHKAAQNLSASIPQGKGGVVNVQQLFLAAKWYKGEACMIESWHALSAAVRAAQEINMHKPSEGLPNFERELRKRMWCILWTWDWQMSTLLSRPLLIDQDDHTLEIPDGRLENISDPNVPHPLSSVALQAELGLHASHLFQALGAKYSVELALELEDELERWMGTFPAALRDHRPDTRWDQKYPNIPFMRCQINIIAYAYLLAPLKPFLLSKPDSEMMSPPLGPNLRAKAVDTCLDLMRASEQFYDLLYPTGFKYFFVIFFMFDAATVLCSAIVHDTENNLPKRSQCIRALRTSQELLDAINHLSESARLSAMLLRKLTPTLPLTEAEKVILGVGSPAPSSAKKIKTSPSSSSPQGQLATATAFGGAGGDYTLSSGGLGNGPPGIPSPSLGGATPYEMPQQYQPHAQAHYTAAPLMPLADPGGIHHPMMPAAVPEWPYDFTAGLTPLAQEQMPQQQQQQHPAGPSSAAAPSHQQQFVGGGGMNPGDALAGTFLEPLWDWEHLDMDLGQYAMPHFAGSSSGPEF